MTEQTKPRGLGEIGRARAGTAAIETLAHIREQGRTVATDAERVVLSGWPGWGPMAKTFAPADGTWSELAERIGTALPDEDLTTGLKGTYMAFYTPRELAAAIWQMLRMFGFDSGPVAELGCGGGAFFATAPEGVPLVGVERDPTAAAICKLMHPNVQIINKPLEDTHLPATFAAVVGNVPFGNVNLFDPSAPGAVTGSLHNYFIWRAVQALTPGGYAILITSRHTMDATLGGGRSTIAEHADFVGAIRLPSGALGGGTEATADVVILRRKGGHNRPTHPHDWSHSGEPEWDRHARINQWWLNEPDSVLGTMRRGPVNQYGLGVAVDPDGKGDVVERLLDYTRTDLAPQATGRNLEWTAPPNPEHFDVETSGVVSAEGWIDGTMRRTPQGGVLVVKGGRALPLPKPGAELLRLLRLRDLAVELVTAEADHGKPDHTIEPIRADVRAVYQDYVKHHGALNRYKPRRAGIDEETGEQLYTRQFPTMQGFRHDADSALVFALEVYEDSDEEDDEDDESGTARATPAPIQSSRQNLPPRRRERTDDPEQALAWCLDRFGGRVRLDYIAAVLGRPLPGQVAEPAATWAVPSGDYVVPMQATRLNVSVRPVTVVGPVNFEPSMVRVRTEDGTVHRALREHVTVLDESAQHERLTAARAVARDELAALLGDKVFLDPTSREWLTAEDYLSGDVRSKHRAAETAAKHDPQFGRNVTALTAVVPKWLTSAEIIANLGAPWIGPTDLETFIAQVIGYQATVKRAAGQWEVDAQGAVRNSVAASVVWGTAEFSAFELVQLALNGKTPVVRKTIIDHNGDEKRVKDRERSMIAGEKQQEIRQRFSDWVWEDSERAARLEHHYNWTYNKLRARSFDGSHIVIDGLAPWFDPYVHQFSFVSRAGMTPAALCGHPVGAGKTASMAMTAIKLKQIGLINKPMMVVPNHLIEQIDREIRQLFPAAKILTGSAKTISANRLAFTARCATGDWDIILVTHSAFNAMDVSAETQARYHEDMEAELRDGVVESAGGQLKGRMVKQLAKMLDRMNTKIQELRHTVRPKDAGVMFEQLGVDYILVDEFHYYKNLATVVRTEGFNVRPSKRATDLDMKLRYLRERNHDGPHAGLFSGTPISNTMLELYICLHYTMRPYLQEIGIGSADSWAAAFVQFVTSVEVTVDGGDFEMRTRPALFVNAPELRVLLSQVADIRTAKQLGLKRPEADLRVIACEPTDLQGWFSGQLVSRAEDVRNRVVDLTVDNMLKICTDGRRMATDPHLVGLYDDGEHKLHIAAEHILAEWRDNPGKLQMGFLDIGTPTTRRNDGGAWTDYQSYGRLRRMLTEGGMDVRRIRFIHDAKDDASKARLFRDCRRGKVDVILGSTDKLGVGTNVQKLIVAMHHIDAPFRPADVEQRDGRGLRPGNIHKIVRIYRYVTKRTFDAYMWQMLTRKLGFISQMMSGELDRTVEDITGDDVLSFAAIKAAATDQPLLAEKAEIQAKLKKLVLKERAHRQTVAQMRTQAPKLRDLAAAKAAESKAWAAIAANADAIDLNDEDTIKLLHDKMDSFRYWSRPLKFGDLSIQWGSWHTPTEHPEIQPKLVIDGGGGNIVEQAWKFWKPADVKRRLRKILDKATAAAALLNEGVAKALAEADSCDEVAAKPFEQSAELASTQARLDQVEADLREAAAPNTPAGDDEKVLPADPADAAPVEPDMDLLAGLTADLVGNGASAVAEFERELADELAGLLDGFEF